MFNLRSWEGDEFRAGDTPQGLPFLSPNAVCSLGNLACTLIGDMHDAVNVSVQQIASTDAHTGDRHLITNAHADGIAVGDDQPGTEVLKVAKGTDFLDITQAAICEDTNGSNALHHRRHHLTTMTAVQAICADILHDHNRWFRGVRQQFVQPLKADALASLGGTIYRAGDGIADSGRQFWEDAANIIAHVPCNTRTHLERFDGVRDCRTINAA